MNADHYNGGMCTDTKKRAMVAMSGGVDSSVAAKLVLDAGLDATGVTCKMFGSNVLADDQEGLDSFMDEVDDAKRVCRKLGIEHYTFNYKDVFERSVIRPFVDSYLCGRTPNPCVDCNRHVKFGALQRRREELGFDCIATGHYARTGFDATTGRWRLMRAECEGKDQSYMLCHLSQSDLAHSMFPLGELSKEEVRSLAEDAGFANARKRESQDVCFIPDGNCARFVEQWSRQSGHAGSLGASGAIEDVSGKAIGRHNGLFRYTIGQRKGIGIAVGEPLYVVDKDVARNVLVVGTRDDLLTRAVESDEVNFVSLAPEKAAAEDIPVLAKTSYRQTPRPATARFTDGKATLVFDEPIARPAPGQALAMYDAETGECVLAGATIC